MSRKLTVCGGSSRKAFLNSQLVDLNGLDSCSPDHLKGKKFTCTNCSRQMVFVPYLESGYFRHTGETNWHLDWKNQFLEKEREVAIGQRIADICTNGNKTVIEVQHSYYPREEIEARSKYYRNAEDRQLYWVLDGTACVAVPIGDGAYSVRGEGSWVYDSFLLLRHVYVHIPDTPGKIDGKVFQVSPKLTQFGCAVTYNFMEVTDFIEGLKIGSLSWPNRGQEYKPTVSYWQFGAGNGKTYRSVRCLNDLHKEMFLFLNKTHSGKDTTTEKLKDYINKPDPDTTFENLQWEPIDNKDRCSLLRKKTRHVSEIYVSIQTMDSFIYSVVQNPHSYNSKNWFECMADGIAVNGDTDFVSNKPTVKKSKIKLGNKAVIIVDEAQDLGLMYHDALVRVAELTGTDVIFIGDKLQSLYTEPNVMSKGYETTESLRKVKDTTQVKLTSKNKNVHFKLEISPNICRRFHNPELIRFVNKMIPFQDFNLPSISGGCHREKCTECQFIREYQGNRFPTFENQPECDEEYEIIGFVDSVIASKVKPYVEKYGFQPKDFMILLPIMNSEKAHSMVETFVTKLQEFWVRHAEKEGKTIQGKCAFSHYSINGQPINLKLSLDKVRLQSIHSSKGTERKVVICIDAKQSMFQYHYTEPGLVKYESLLHVAFTRPTMFLHIYGAVSDTDSIYRKYKMYHEDIDDGPALALAEPIYSFYHNIDRVANMESGKFRQFPDIETEDIRRVLVDIQNYWFRYGAAKISFELFLTREFSSDEFNRHKGIIIKIAKADVNSRDSISRFYKDNKVNHKSVTKLKNAGDYEVYLLGKYLDNYTELRTLVDKVKTKLQTRDSNMCHVERVILYYMWQNFLEGNWTKFSVNQLHDFIYEMSVGKTSHDSRFNCDCNQVLGLTAKNKTGYNLHYDFLNGLEPVFRNSIKAVQKVLGQKLGLALQNIELCYEDFHFICKQGYFFTDSQIVLYKVVPPITNMNKDEVSLEAVFLTFLAKYGKAEDSDKGNRVGKDKKIHMLFITGNDFKLKCYDSEDYLSVAKTRFREFLEAYYKEYISKLFAYLRQSSNNYQTFYGNVKGSKKEKYPRAVVRHLEETREPPKLEVLEQHIVDSFDFQLGELMEKCR